MSCVLNGSAAGMTISPNSSRTLEFAVLALVVAAFIPSLGGGFLADDFAYIARFREFPWSEFPTLFSRDWSGGIWGIPLRELRPFVALSFMGDARLFGGDPLGYRLTNLGLHLIATFLVMRLAAIYVGPPTGVSAEPMHKLAVLSAGLVFGLHPAHAEAVGWITGRVDVQATAAALLFLVASDRFSVTGCWGRAGVAGAALFLGIFSKELCLFAPLILLLRWVAFDLRAGKAVWLRRLTLFAGIAILLTIYSACRRAAFGHDSIGYNLWTDAPAWQRQAHYAGWLWPLLPFTTKGEWQNLPSLAVLHGIWITIAVISLAGFALALWRRAAAVAALFFFGGVWYLVTVFPMTGVVYFTPRHLYFPSVGMALAVGFLVILLPRRKVIAGIFVVWCLLGHVFALRPWIASANISKTALAGVNRELSAAIPGTVLVTSVPETNGPTLLWAWSSPHCVSPPFVVRAADHVIDRPANYVQADRWTEDRKPSETMRAAKSLVALHVDAAGLVNVRRVDGAEMTARVEAFLQLATSGGLNPDSLSAWVRTVAAP